MIDPKRISELPFLSQPIASDAVIVIVQNGTTYRLNYGTLNAGVGAPQTLTQDPATGAITISGGNTISIQRPEFQVSGSNEFNLPAGSLLWRIVIVATGDQTIDIGTTIGGDEIISIDMLDGDILRFQPDFYTISGQVIYFTASDSLVKLYFN